MAGLTNLELFGADGFNATGNKAATGSDIIIVPPAAVAAAGPLAIVAWILDQLVQAQATDTAATAIVAKRSTTEQAGVIKQTYTIVLSAPAADIAGAFAANVTDPFS